MNETTQEEGAIFEAARGLPEGQRASYLEKTCGADTQLRQRLETRLAARLHSGQTTAIPKIDNDETVDASTVVSPPIVSTFPEETLGSTIGRYKLLEMIGEGGFGSVYVAEQKEPVIRRVALKVIKLGMDTRQVVARFEAERQALAMMDHPNIAKVLDAGATEAGRPYFVMELVRGVRITDYCDQNKLSTHKRLDLFIQVCHAIEHAHQKGIIHRDIKPSNILVSSQDGLPVPKVIDFGIAKATSGRLTDKTVYTQTDQFVGTPAYMSPEQAEMGGLDVDTRSDIYSLGVLLYELLTAETPFESRNLLERGFDEMRRIIREIEPQLPSLRLRTKQDSDQTSTAKRHGTDAPKLINLMRGDLDWVVMKCLEKDRTRRYDTAGLLAADVQRFLDNEPVSARPPSTLYRFQKLVLRNRLAFAASAGIWVALVIALGVTSWFVIKEKQERDLAQIESASAKRDRQISDKARDEAQAAEEKAHESQRQAEDAQRKAEAALKQSELDRARALVSQKQAEAALQRAREEHSKAEAATVQAKESQSEAHTAQQQAANAETKAAVEAAKSEEAAKAAVTEASLRQQAEAEVARLRQEGEAARQRADASLQQARTAQTAALAETAELRGAFSNAFSRLDSLPPAEALKVAGLFLSPAIQNQGWATPFLRRRGDWRARQGDWTGAADDFTALLSLEPDAPEPYHALAPLLLQTGDLPGYARTCAAFLARFGATNDLAIGRLLAKDCVLAASTNVDLAKVAALARQAAEAGTNDSHFAESALTLALAEYRQGRFAEAAAQAKNALDAAEQNAACQAQAAAVLALAQVQLKQTDLARGSLAKGQQIMQAKLPKVESGDLGPQWEEGLAARRLIEEARALTKAPPAVK